VVAVIGSTSGIKALMDEHPDITITVGTVDNTVTDEGVILPGLGDAGDRLFGTEPLMADDEESLLHPSRRKRTLSQSLP
jgi:uracil phosphoribosyltransferase